MAKIYVISAKKDVPAYKPDGSKLNPDGEFVVDSQYWQRRILDKEVKVTKAPEKEKKGNK